MKTMKYLAVAAAVILALAACDKDDEPAFVPSLTFDADELSADAEGGFLSVGVRTDIPYEVVMPQEADWIRLLEEAQGTQGEAVPAMLSFEVDKHTAGAARTAAVVIRAMEGTPADTLHISQSGVADDADITEEFDPVFAKLLELLELIPDAQQITFADVKGIETVYAFWSDYRLASVRGIEYLESLARLYLDTQYDITSLDLSKNTELKILSCQSMDLTSLDVSRNSKLESLDCYQNQLTALDVSHNPELKVLVCDWNQLTALDVSHNTKLTALYCGGNRLTSLDLTHCPELESFTSTFNQFTALDLSKNTKLTYLECTDLHMPHLDLSANTELTYLWCAGGKLTSLDLTRCTKLANLFCFTNQITSLDLTHCTELVTLRCHNNRLTSLDLAQCTKLESLGCQQNLLTGVDISHNQALKDLMCENNPGRDGFFEVVVWPGCELKVTNNVWNEVKSWDYEGETVTVKYTEK